MSNSKNMKIPVLKANSYGRMSHATKLADDTVDLGSSYVKEHGSTIIGGLAGLFIGTATVTVASGVYIAGTTLAGAGLGHKAENMLAGTGAKVKKAVKAIVD